MSEMTEEEWEEFLLKHQYSQRMFSVIVEGGAVVFLHNKKKRAKTTGSRGKYISDAIIYYEKHRQSPDLIKTAQDEAFDLQLRVWYLERTLRENGIKFDLK